MCITRLPEVVNATISKECIAKNASSVAMRVNQLYGPNASIEFHSIHFNGEMQINTTDVADKTVSCSAAHLEDVQNCLHIRKAKRP